MSDAPTGRVHHRARFRRLLGGVGDAPLSPEQLRVRRAAHAHSRVPIGRWMTGWFVIVLGILGIFLPLLPALVLLPIGVALVGRRSTVVRCSRTRTKLLLRVAETWHGVPGRLGKFLRERERRMATYLRHRRLGKWERPRRDGPA